MSDYNLNPRKTFAKHPTCVEVGECRPSRRSGKQTRHWCKGRVGIPHTWEWTQWRHQIDLAHRMGITYNRITEEPVCFGCDKVDSRQRSYCRQCGEPWPRLVHTPRQPPYVAPCIRCGAEYLVRPPRPHALRNTWRPSGSVVIS